MKLMFDVLPIILFFVAFKIKGIFVATAVAIAASLVQMLYVWLRTRKVEPVMLISALVVLVFGGSTLVLHNEAFIKWKPTVLYWIFAVVLAGFRYISGKNLVQAMLQQQVAVPAIIWERLLRLWIGFFVVLGAANLVVAYHVSTAAWVNFKLFGITGCLVIFTVIQAVIIMPYMDKEKSEPEQ